MRSNSRNAQQLRAIKLTRQYTKYAEGSVLVEFGDTQVICTATAISGVPLFLKEKNQGWVTAEYGMLPRSTQDRMAREATKGKQVGRTQEIQRLIGRSLRAAVNLKALEGYTITVDCDVIQADGGTRTAAITGGCVALYDAIQYLITTHQIQTQAFKQFVAAVSVGLYQNEAILDLDYVEDVAVDTDMNIVMTEQAEFIEIQGTAEKEAYTFAQLNTLLALGQKGIKELITQQRLCVGLS